MYFTDVNLKKINQIMNKQKMSSHVMVLNNIFILESFKFS